MLTVRQSSRYCSQIQVRPIECEAVSVELARATAKQLAIQQACQVEYDGIAFILASSLERPCVRVKWNDLSKEINLTAGGIVRNAIEESGAIVPELGRIKQVEFDRFIFMTDMQSDVLSGVELELRIQSELKSSLALGKAHFESSQKIAANCRCEWLPDEESLVPVAHALCFGCGIARFWEKTDKGFVCGTCGRSTGKLV